MDTVYPAWNPDVVTLPFAGSCHILQQFTGELLSAFVKYGVQNLFLVEQSELQTMLRLVDHCVTRHALNKNERS